MNRLTRTATALVLTAMTATSAFAGPGLMALNSNLASKLDVRINQALPQVEARLPALTVCPDLSVKAKQRELADGSIRVTVEVKNLSGADYVSAPGQQRLVIEGRNGGRSGAVPFVNLARGDVIAWADTFRPFEFPASYKAYLALDPDIFIDGNERNDDCRADNNRVALTTIR